jgi:hypothetical protein
MALDLLVMPLHRYLAGDFKTSTQLFAESTGMGEKYVRVGGTPSVPIDEAREFVRAMRVRLRQALGEDIRWRDDGETVLCRQLHRGAWHALRAFAADQQAPVAGFVYDDRSHEHPNLGPIFGGKPSAFVHLIRHTDANGFYLPCDFDRPFEMPLLAGEPVTPLVGSSLRLLKELNALESRLGLRIDEGQEGWTDQLEQNDSLELTKTGWLILRHAVRLSVANKLPLIFDGQTARGR